MKFCNNKNIKIISRKSGKSFFLDCNINNENLSEHKNTKTKSETYYEYEVNDTHFLTFFIQYSIQLYRSSMYGLFSCFIKICFYVTGCVLCAFIDFQARQGDKEEMHLQQQIILQSVYRIVSSDRQITAMPICVNLTSVSQYERAALHLHLHP